MALRRSHFWTWIRGDLLSGRCQTQGSRAREIENYEIVVPEVEKLLQVIQVVPVVPEFQQVALVPLVVAQ